MAIAITIKPQHLFNILNGTKLGEIRKNKALINAVKKKIAEKGKAIIYCICSKNGGNLISLNYNNKYYVVNDKQLKDVKMVYNLKEILNGKVVCKFECKNVEEIKYHCHKANYDGKEEIIWEDYATKSVACGLLEEHTCLNYEDMKEYFGGKRGYLIHISNLKIFDKAKEIGELRKRNGYCDGDFYWESLKKAPQNFCYVEDTL